jgi:hypothetical protein
MTFQKSEDSFTPRRNPKVAQLLQWFYPFLLPREKCRLSNVGLQFVTFNFKAMRPDVERSELVRVYDPVVFPQ